MFYGYSFLYGLRVSELISLQRKDFEEAGEPKKFLEVIRKGEKKRSVAIPAPLYFYYLRPLFTEKKLRASEYIFKTRDKKPFGRQRINAIYRRYASKTRVSLKKASPCKFRHLYALTVLNSCKNIEVVRQQLGHSFITTTAIYLNQTKDEQYEQVARAFIDY